MTTLADCQVGELLAHIVNPASDLARSSPYGAIKAARLQSILHEIAMLLLEPDLSADRVGRRLGLSGSYVQQLLAGAGYSFSTYVRELRLDRARQLLRSPQFAEKRTIDICWSAGFSDLSYFNRSFRARFGRTPTDMRRS